MKRYALPTLIGFFLTALAAHACEVCGAGQPDFLGNYAHGKTPNGPWDYVIVAIVALGTISVVPYTFRCLVRPGETASSHIKNSVINRENHGD